MTRNGNIKNEAFEAFIQIHRDAIRHYCWQYAGGDDERCKDLVQEVCIALWLHFDELRDDANKWQQRAWVKKITHSKLVDLYRRGERLPLVSLTNAMSATIPDSNSSSREEDLEEIMVALNPEERVLVRMYIDGYRGEEIADIMRLKRGAVYQRMFRVMSKVRKVIVVVLVAFVATAMALVAVPQLREWVIPSLGRGDAHKEENMVPQRQMVPVADTLPDSASLCGGRDGRNERDKTIGKRSFTLTPMPTLYELNDTSRPMITSTKGILCGCHVVYSPNVSGSMIGSLVGHLDCDTNDDETKEMSDVSILVNGNIIVVEDAYNELVSVFDNQGRIVASTQCNGHCSIIVNPDGLTGRGTNSIPYWVQVGSRARERVYLQFPSLNTGFPITY